MTSEEEKKEGEAIEEQGEGKDVQDQMLGVSPPEFGRRRHFDPGPHPDLREVWREPLGA